MEEMGRLGHGAHRSSAPTGAAITKAKDASSIADPEDDAEDQQDGPVSNHGVVLEGMSNCTIEMSPDGTVLVVGQAGKEALRRYGVPRPAHAPHPPCVIGGERGERGEPRDRAGIVVPNNSGI
jgi:hypothetical protein